MRHPDSRTLTRLATGGAAAPETRAHVDGCAVCRGRLAALEVAWASLEAGDPAARAADAPLWPGVLASLKGRNGVASPAPRLAPAWKLALSEARHAPLAWAALVAVAAGAGGGHVAGRAMLGRTPPDAVSAAWADAGEYSSYSGLEAGSLGYSYLEEDLEAIGSTLVESGDDGTGATPDSGAEGGGR